MTVEEMFWATVAVWIGIIVFTAVWLWFSLHGDDE